VFQISCSTMADPRSDCALLRHLTSGRSGQSSHQERKFIDDELAGVKDVGQRRVGMNGTDTQDMYTKCAVLRWQLWVQDTLSPEQRCTANQQLPEKVLSFIAQLLLERDQSSLEAELCKKALANAENSAGASSDADPANSLQQGTREDETRTSASPSRVEMAALRASCAWASEQLGWLQLVESHCSSELSSLRGHVEETAEIQKTQQLQESEAKTALMDAKRALELAHDEHIAQRCIIDELHAACVEEKAKAELYESEHSCNQLNTSAATCEPEREPGATWPPKAEVETTHLVQNNAALEKEVAELHKLCEQLANDLSRMHQAHAESVADSLHAREERSALLRRLQQAEVALETQKQQLQHAEIALETRKQQLQQVEEALETQKQHNARLNAMLSVFSPSEGRETPRGRQIGRRHTAQNDNDATQSLRQAWSTKASYKKATM